MSKSAIPVAPDPATTTQLRALIAQGETSQVELKVNPPRPAELAERICGMANRRSGGMILFGIADAGQLTGVKDAQGAMDLIYSALRLLRPLVDAPAPTLDAWLLEGVPLLLLTIPPNNGTLYQAGGVFWRRNGTHTIPMTATEIEAHLGTYGTVPWETKLCRHATLEDLDRPLIDRYLSLRAETSRQRLRFTEFTDLLIGLECAGLDAPTGVVRPTHVGMLLFGIDPQFHLPHSEVVCIRYPDPLGAGKYLDRKNLTGPVPELIDQATKFLQFNMRMGGEIQGFKRIDQPEYPLEALREAVTNAIAHRDYSLQNQSVRIFMYPDRVEIHSPGLLLPGISLADLTTRRVPSQPRNYRLAAYLREIPGYMEKVGSGIRLMIYAMRQASLPDPVFEEQHEFVVVLYGSGAAPETLAATATDVTLPLQAPVAVPPALAAADFDIDDLNERQIIAMQLVRTHGMITSREYAEATGAPERTALRDLRDLVDRGILQRHGEKRNARYSLPS